MKTGLEKPKKHSSKEYLDWIRMHDCVSCGAPGPNMAHHARKLDPGRATQGKVSDYNAVPLCDVCHRSEHTGYPMEDLELWQSAFALLREYVEEKLAE